MFTENRAFRLQIISTQPNMPVVIESNLDRVKPCPRESFAVLDGSNADRDLFTRDFLGRSTTFCESLNYLKREPATSLPKTYAFF
jgi:hypothetical protein